MFGYLVLGIILFLCVYTYMTRPKSEGSKVIAEALAQGATVEQAPRIVINIQEIRRELSSNDIKRKEEILGKLKDIFWNNLIMVNDFETCVNLLIDFSLEESAEKLLKEVFVLLENIVDHQMVYDVDINFDAYEKNINNVSEDNLPSCIRILAYTYNDKYHNVIMRFENHKNPLVQEAIDEYKANFEDRF